MSLNDTPRYTTEENPEVEYILDKFYKAYIELKRVYKERDIRVVINGENNITIIDNDEYTYCYRED